MRTRCERYAFILLVLLVGASLSSAAVQPYRQANPAAPTAPPQAADARSITGEWQGMVARLHLIVKIEQAADGTLTGKLTSVDQGNITISIDAVSFAPSTGLRLELKSIAAAYEGKLNEDGSELVGTWQQSGNSIALSFHRPGANADKPTLKPRTMGSV
ncbi:MAG TPA: hypothetical protein VHN10_13405, partial [Candidatus Acidoferrales bacterium]|nr:hypothetical protein [Candidatus Acidoferrales bacterium]